MMKRIVFKAAIMLALICWVASCTREKEQPMKFTGAKEEVKLITLDPGHFHAALLQKRMYDQVDPVVHIYAPEGPDVKDHLNRIDGFNSRAENPTHWESRVYTGPDFLEKMIAEKAGNVVIISGNNRKKTEYIKAAVNAGLNVLADKPMCIDQNGFNLLKQAFALAKEHGVLLYDIMTERYEITTALQKALAQEAEVFGTLQPGTVDNPAVTKESVHHFFKYVAGNPIKRPAWYMDVTQQGEGLVDVTTHLVDLVQWECFPEQIINYETDVEMLKARRWPTMITKQQYQKVTRLPDFPDYLKPILDKNGVLPVYANGEMIYKLKGVHAKVSVIWNFQAPEGAGDTHFSIMRGTKSNVIIRQGKEQNYRPELYVEVPDKKNRKSVEQGLNKAISDLQTAYPGLAVEKIKNGWHVIIPDKYRIGHEAHFGQVTEKYLRFLVEGKLPEWEVPNMIAKYYTTTAALALAKSGK